MTGVSEAVESLCGLVMPPRDRWLGLLLDGAPLQDVCRAYGRPMAELLARVSALELRGELVRLPTGRYSAGRSVDKCTMT